MAALTWQGAFQIADGLQPSHSLPMTVGSAAGNTRLIGIATISTNVLTNNWNIVQVDGVDATQVGPAVRQQEVSSSLSGTYLTFWTVPGTAATNITLFVASSPSQTYCVYAAVWNLGDNEGLLDTAQSNADDPILDIDAAAGGAVAAIGLAYSLSSFASTWSGLTEQADGISLFGVDLFTAADLNTVANATPLGVSITWPVFAGAGGDSRSALALSFGELAIELVGTLDVTLEALTLLADGDITASVAGDVDATLDELTLSATGTSLSGLTGDLDVELGVLALSVTGAVQTPAERPGAAQPRLPSTPATARAAGTPAIPRPAPPDTEAPSIPGAPEIQEI